MTVLAIDIGTKMGWALRTDAGAIKSGTIVFKKFDHEGARYHHFRRWLTEMKNKAGHIDQVYYEVVKHGRKFDNGAGQVHGGFKSILAAWCFHHDIPIEGVHIATIKKHATGSGRAEKEDVIEAMKKKGHKPKDDNEADALALLHCKAKA